VYPNPQDALPFPSDPHVERYEGLAEDLVRACTSSDPTAIRGWATRWVRALALSLNDPVALRDDAEIGARANQVDEFARRKLAGSSSRCALSDAQFVVAQVHGFPSWHIFLEHIESLARQGSTISNFEAAAQAIVSGDIATLRRLLQEQPELIRARSTREHRATLLHYVSANGVENYRQLSPGNIAEITELLLAAGADVDAEADVYGGGCTALGLVATSAPPFNAGVQQDVIEVLLKHGARMDRNGAAGNQQSLVRACLANGQPSAAEYLASRGAPVDLPGAAGLGRLDVVKALIDQDSGLAETQTIARLRDSFSLACAYGRSEVVDFLLSRGFNVDEELTSHGHGHTGLHVAAYHGHVDVVQTLLRHGARVDVIDKTWGTPPLIWALTGWSGRPAADSVRYYDVVARLVAAGATVKPELLEWDRARADPRMLAALMTKTTQ
jgi:ankyrin repeat protein